MLSAGEDGLPGQSADPFGIPGETIGFDGSGRESLPPSQFRSSDKFLNNFAVFAPQTHQVTFSSDILERQDDRTSRICKGSRAESVIPAGMCLRVNRSVASKTLDLPTGAQAGTERA